MKKLLMAITATLIAASPAFAKPVKNHQQPQSTKGLYLQANPESQDEDAGKPAMMNRGLPNTSPDPFIYEYLIRSYRSNGQG